MGRIEEKRIPEQMKEHYRREIMVVFERMRTRDRELRRIIKENPEAEVFLPELNKIAEAAENIAE
jgi:hypothetical protein